MLDPQPGIAGNRAVLLLGECGKGGWWGAWRGLVPAVLPGDGQPVWMPGGNMSPKSPSDPVSFGSWRTETPSPAQALLGTCPLYLFEACLDGGFLCPGKGRFLFILPG